MLWTVLACIIQAIATVLMLLFASNLDLPLGPLNGKVPVKLGMILGIIGWLLTGAAVGIIMYDLPSIDGLQIMMKAFADLSHDHSDPTVRLSIISKLSYAWMVLWGQGTFCTAMGVLAAKGTATPLLEGYVAQAS